jgi:predicted ATP-grasp superfamily ATP-dependent carboligase
VSYVRWESRPELRRPVLVAAFEGWNDAAEAASTAARYLATRLGARPFATFDPEEFYDFTVTRPQVRLEDGVTRSIHWPTPTLEAASVSAAQRDVVFLHAVEPALKWRTYAAEMIDVCRELGVDLVVTLGALLADVPHTRPIRVMGTAANAQLVAELGLQRSRYEGPTGIVGVLHDACSKAGIPSASLWASTPHYLAQTPSPRAALALVERTAALLGTRLDSLDLQVAAAAYDRQVDDMVSSEEEVADYVRRLEQESQDDDGIETLPGDALAAEVERFLRDQRGNGG